VTSDGPGDCEYGTPKVGKPFTTTFVVQAGAPTKRPQDGHPGCVHSEPERRADPAPGNNCRSATKLSR